MDHYFEGMAISPEEQEFWINEARLPMDHKVELHVVEDWIANQRADINKLDFDALDQKEKAFHSGRLMMLGGLEKYVEQIKDALRD
jgi:hypothetical protein